MLIESPTTAWKDYELIDCGDFAKLERFGKYITIRPEPKAIWKKTLSDAEWEKMAHTRFIPGGGFSTAGQQDSGSWKTLKRMDQQWPIVYQPLNLTLRMGMTSFKHVGVFPEQAPNWDFIYSNTKRLVDNAGGAPVKVLNLFAYTGAATMACAAAGAAEVVHVDAAKGMVQWAKENRDLSNLDDRKIRFIVDDCLKFVEREKRRGRTYHGILMDPPSYGRGPNGEMWKFEKEITGLIRACLDIFDKDALFFLINSYTTGFSSVVLEDLMKVMILPEHPSGVIETGEVAIPVRDRDLMLPCGIYGRWERR